MRAAQKLLLRLPAVSTTAEDDLKSRVSAVYQKKNKKKTKRKTELCLQNLLALVPREALN